ncbi:MAG: methionyl-tRNA formyltransferase [Aeoliella sp.]
MRIVMLGTGPFAVPTLGVLAASAHDVVLVVSRPFRARKNVPLPPMHVAANDLGIELWTPQSVNLPESVERLSEQKADLLVVCDYGEILKPAALGSTRLGGVNLHGSLLPKYRGAAPVQWAVLNGDAETGNTVIQMTPGLDAGPCLAQQRVTIDPDETAGELEDRLALHGADAVLEVVRQLAADTAMPVKQDNSAASKAPRLAKQDGLIDWSQPALAIKNQVRAMHPWPKAYSFWHIEGREPLRVVIDKVRFAAPSQPEPTSQPDPPSEPARPGSGLAVETGDGLLEILELQPAGKRTMTAEEFLRGYGGGWFTQ